MKKIFILTLFFFSTFIVLKAQQSDIDSLKNILRTAQNDSVKASLYHRIGNKYYELSDYKNALANYDRALQLWRKIKNTEGIARSSNNIGIISYEQGKYSKAFEYYSISLDAETARNNKQGVADTKNNIGPVYHALGIYDKALEYYLQASHIFEETGDTLNYAKVWNNIGRINTERKHYDTAIAIHKKAFTTFKEIGDKNEMAIALNNIGAAYSQKEDFSSAEENYMKIIQFQDEVGKLSVIVDAYINLGSLKSKQKKYGEAIKYFQDALTISKDSKYPTGTANALISLGKLFFDRSDFQKAKKYLNSGTDIAMELGAKEISKSGYEILYELYKDESDYSNALRYYESFIEIKDILFNEENNKQIEKLKIEYEAEKNVKQISDLKKENLLKGHIAEQEKENADQQRKSKWLAILLGSVLILGAAGFGYYRNKKIKSEALKETSEAKLASLKSLMDKHFISGSLNSIDAFLSNHDSESASNYLVKYSKLIRNILHFSTEPEVTLEEELELCKSYLYLEKIHYDNCFDYSFDIDANLSLSDTLFPSVLLQPLVENAVKHGMGSLMSTNGNRKGMISVSIVKADDKLVCKVTDNGAGLGFAKSNSDDHRSYSGKGISERVRVYNTLRKNKASFSLTDNGSGVTAELVVPFMATKHSQRMTA